MQLDEADANCPADKNGSDPHCDLQEYREQLRMELAEHDLPGGAMLDLPSFDPSLQGPLDRIVKAIRVIVAEIVEERRWQKFRIALQ